jgi:enoyl-CoA hydratase/3-hydroxyacyl-CoA dehydrogenase
MNIGVIGSGSIGPDLAYGFVSAVAKGGDGKVYLHDIRQEALDAGMERIRGYIGKGLSRGKISARAARAIEAALVPTLKLADLADCDYVMEAATEHLETKRKILAKLEQTVGPDCLIGFATSGIPRSRIAAEASRPERCFVNHPFFPAWRALPIEVVLSGDARYGDRMLDTLTMLGKIPIVTSDVPCFAADDIFCNYCAEAARIVVEGLATPAQVDAIVNTAIGGGGPFNVMDLTQGNLLNVHCLELMQAGPEGTDWFAPPEIFTRQGNTPWLDRKSPGDPTHDPALARQVLDRILAVLLGRTYYVVDREICDPTELNWLTRTALGFREGLLDLAASLGPDRVHQICTEYAQQHPGFGVPKSIADRQLAVFHGNVKVQREAEIAVVTIYRPEVKNALNERTMEELKRVFDTLAEDPAVRGVVLTSPDGSLAGADITELAALPTPAAAAEKCRRGQAVLDRIAAFAKPVVAAVDGPVLGGGAELSMACHARVVGRAVMLGQPEVNLGIIPGYGGTQRLPRLIGIERGQDLLRTGRPVGAREACEWGWAHGEPAGDFVGVAKELVRRHIEGEVKLEPVVPSPVDVPDPLPAVELGHRSLAVDAILVDTLRRGLTVPLSQGLEIEAENFARCQQTVDYDIGMKNFMQNGPRVPAVFMNE